MYLLTWVTLHIHYTRGLTPSSVILFLGVKMKIEDKVLTLSKSYPNINKRKDIKLTRCD